ncbi:UbiA family prenyltransferase [Tardiphaga sp. vice278]|uniref:UbiA family prenyltransferase n=1 Tax=Tardiphaga sp. vice278 TaxID=2592815 RepID=UPI00143DEC55|nr:UbiA family prenyltransferase [Tardiphaga sp. vice278]
MASPSDPAVPAAPLLPLCVDFDGTLVRTDAIYECFVGALKSRPIALLRIAPLLLRSRAAFKAALWRIAGEAIDVGSFPREPKVVGLIEQARREGRPVELVSASDLDLLRSDPQLVGMFDAIVGSDGQTNVKGPNKAALLQARHPGGFDYVGDSTADLPVFEAARKGYGVGLSAANARALADRQVPMEQLVAPRSAVPALLKSLRLHQWFKNILIFVPVGLAVGMLGAAEILRMLSGFVLLGLLASATYLVNDLFDLPSDRRHPRKSARPLASGALPILWALVAAPSMIVLTLIAGYLLEPGFAAVLALYLALTLAYSFRLKRTPIMDVLVIGLLFTLRVVAGMTLGPAASSQWLLIFSVFFFTGLALMKRDAEIAVLQASDQSALKGRGYTVADRPFVQIVGVGTSIASLVIFAMFIAAIFENSRQYSAPYFLWVAYFLLAYWMLRLWFMSFRGHMHDDPIVFAIKEPKSIAIFGVIGLVCLLSQVF